MILMVILSALMGLMGLVFTALLVREFLKWRKERPSRPFSEAMARSRTMAYLPLLFSAMGLYGAGQLTDGERDQVIGLYTGRAVGMALFLILTLRGAIDLLTDERLLTKSVFYFMVTNPHWQTVLLGLAAGMVAQGYYRRRMI